MSAFAALLDAVACNPAQGVKRPSLCSAGDSDARLSGKCVCNFLWKKMQSFFHHYLKVEEDDSSLIVQ